MAPGEAPVIATGLPPPVDGVLEYAGKGAVVFRRDDQHRVGVLDHRFEAADGLRHVGPQVFIVMRQAGQVGKHEAHAVSGQLFQCPGEFAIDRIIAQRPDQNSYLTHDGFLV